MIHKIKVSLSVGLDTYEDKLEVEIPDNATVEQIDELKTEALKGWMQNYLDYWYEPLD
jgi:hypothetical protein